MLEQIRDYKIIKKLGEGGPVHRSFPRYGGINQC